MSKINSIIIHCSDSEFGSAAMIRQWHLARGWRDIGYHFVITNGQLSKNLYLPALDGQVEVGRMMDGTETLNQREQGAHDLAHNKDGIGICLIGVSRFSAKQFGALISLVEDLGHQYQVPAGQVFGHYESPMARGKTCPNLDMIAFRGLLNKEALCSIRV